MPVAREQKPSPSQAMRCFLCHDDMGEGEDFLCPHFNRKAHFDCFIELGSYDECGCREEAERIAAARDGTRAPAVEQRRKNWAIWLQVPDSGPWGDPFNGRDFSW